VELAVGLVTAVRAAVILAISFIPAFVVNSGRCPQSKGSQRNSHQQKQKNALHRLFHNHPLAGLYIGPAYSLSTTQQRVEDFYLFGGNQPLQSQLFPHGVYFSFGGGVHAEHFWPGAGEAFEFPAFADPTLAAQNAARMGHPGLFSLPLQPTDGLQGQEARTS
jgi:hypothetical protein